MKKDFPVWQIGLAQATTVTLYVICVVSLMNWLGNSNLVDNGQLWGPIIALLLFVLSAGICGSLVFGYPVYLFIQTHWLKALKTLAWTFLFFVGYLALLFFAALMFVAA